MPSPRPVSITGLASDERLVERLGLHGSNYEGPTGIVGVLHDRLRSAGVSSASLWAAVPHYVSIAPNPKAALALVGRLATLVGTQFDTSELTQAAVAYEREVGRAVEADSDVASYVHELEERADALGSTLEDLPSGETLAAEFEQFLAEQDDEQDQ